MAILVVAETLVPDIVSTLSAALPYLRVLIESGDAYMRSNYVILRDSILRLCDQLNICQNHFNDEADRERLLLKARISASKTFALIYYLHNSPHGIARSIFCSCACADTERVEKLKLQSDETQRLADDFSTFLRGTNSDQKHGQESNQPLGQESETLRESSAGVNKLELVTPRNLASKIKQGKRIQFTVSDASQRRVYTATQWLNNPHSLFGTAKRMSATLQNATAGAYDIRHPEETHSSSGKKARTAVISSGGYLHATVSSIKEERRGIGRSETGNLLKSDHFRQQSDGNGGSSRRYDEQRYDVLLAFSHIQILGLHSGGVGRLRLLGRKKREKAYYECFVEATGEVLATYRHKQNKKIGVLHFLGVGNKPEVRDLIFATFIAMGLTRSL